MLGVSSKPAIINKVVLPEPLGPKMPMSSPALMVSEAFRSA